MKRSAGWRLKSLVPLVILVMSLAAGVILIGEKSRIRTQAAEPTQKTLAGMRLAADTEFRRWVDWFPVDFGQPENYRMINWWDSTALSAHNLDTYGVYGISSLNVPNNIGTLPFTYQGKNVDYFYIWQCRRLGDPTDPNCYNMNYSREIVSQGSAVDNVGKTTLEHWAHGGYYRADPNNSVLWQVYYDPVQIGGINKCNGRDLAASGIDLTRAEIKKPWVLKLPVVENTYYISDPVCAIEFMGYNQDKSKIVDARYKPQPQEMSNNGWQTGAYIWVTVTDGVFNDNWGHPIVRAENIYLTDNYDGYFSPSEIFKRDYCDKLANQGKQDSLRCPGGSPLAVTDKNNKVYKTFGFEEYYMRQTKSSGRYPGVVDRYGYGSFRWQGNQWNDWDRIRNDGSIDTVYGGAENQIYDMQNCQLNSWLGIVSCTGV